MPRRKDWRNRFKGRRTGPRHTQFAMTLDQGAMMRTTFRKSAALGSAVLALSLSPLWAQKPKSQKEVQAITAVQVAATPDDRIKAVENVLTNFADTEFKVPLLQIAVQA